VVDGQQVAARTERGDLQPANLGEGAGVADESGESGARADGIARDQHDAVRDPVPEEGAPVVVEVVVRVPP
jgi:hypothetical protein